MKSTETLHGLPPNRVLGIDPSTTSFAFTHMVDKKIEKCGKIDFPKHSNMVARAKIINEHLTEQLLTFKPDLVAVEQMIYIQNPQTSRELSYTVGYIIGKASELNIPIIDVGPMTWKAFIGYKNVRKTDIAEWAKEIGEKEAKKKAAFERKDRVRSIMFHIYPEIEEEDYDIWDSIAIAYWGTHQTNWRS